MPIGAIIGAVGNAISTDANNAKAQQREDRARRQNYQYGEMAADEADTRTRALYNDLYSPEAQMKQLKDAGLSPSIYSNSGITGKQGQSGAQGGGANISPNVFAADPISAALAAAQIKKTEAEANKTEAETPDKNLTIQQIKANIAKTLSEVNLNNIKGVTEQTIQRFNNAKTNYQELLNIYADGQQEADIKYKTAATEKIWTEIYNLNLQGYGQQLQNEYDKQTLNTRIKKTETELAQLVAQKALTYAQKNLTEEQAKALVDQVKVAQDNARTNKMNAETARQHIENQVEQWAKQNGFTEEQLRQSKTKMWLDYTVDMIGCGIQFQRNAIGVVDALIPG